MTEFTKYKNRKVDFLKVELISNWKVKIYTLTINDSFQSSVLLEAAIIEAAQWLKKSKSTNLKTYRIATLILHEAREGIFSIINWWTDESMLQNFVFFTPYNCNPIIFKLYSDKGIISCVWELAVFWHERNAWINHVLKNPDNPNFEDYLNDTMKGLI